MEDHRADKVEFWGTWLVILLWIATTVVMGLAWRKGLTPPWGLWIGFTVLTCVAVAPQGRRLFSRFNRS